MLLPGAFGPMVLPYCGGSREHSVRIGMIDQRLIQRIIVRTLYPPRQLTIWHVVNASCLCEWSLGAAMPLVTLIS